MRTRTLLALVSPLLLGAVSARGDVVAQTTSLSGTITLTNGVLTGSNIAGNYTFFAPFAVGSGSETLSFSANVGAAGSFGPIFDASVSNIQFSILSGSTNVLSGTAVSGTLFGFDGSLVLKADTTPDNNQVVFTSDVINASQLSNPDLNLQVLNDSGLSITAGTLDDFTAEPGTGAFDAAVPEPASIGLLGMGSLLMFRRRRAIGLKKS